MFQNLMTTLNNTQSVFRKHHSCETVIQFVFAKWREYIDSLKSVLSVSVGIRRVFETVNDTIVLEKLQFYDLDETVHTLKPIVLMQ